MIHPLLFYVVNTTLVVWQTYYDRDLLVRMLRSNLSSVIISAPNLSFLTCRLRIINYGLTCTFVKTYIILWLNSCMVLITWLWPYQEDSLFFIHLAHVKRTFLSLNNSHIVLKNMKFLMSHLACFLSNGVSYCKRSQPCLI